MLLVPNSEGRRLREFNPHHDRLGQFSSAPGDGTGGGGSGDYQSPGEQAAAQGRVRRATPEEFQTALLENTRAATLSTYTVEELSHMQLFMLDHDGPKAGYAIKDGDELVNLFNNGNKGAGPWLVVHAVEHGARRGDHFDGHLTAFYGRLGFREVKREANWTAGEPAVIYMEWNGGDPQSARTRYGQHRRLDRG